jgi:hypothetical protein
VEIFILDALLREIDVVDEDQYESFIWTERYAERGDFQIVARSTQSMKNRFSKDTLFVIRDSKRIMRVNTTTENIDEEKGPVLTIKGFELVWMLEQRISTVKEEDGNLRAVTYWNGWKPIELMNDMVWRACVDATWLLMPGDAIPFLNDWHVTPGSLYPASNIDEPEPLGILWEQKMSSVYSAVKDVADSYDLGFRLYKDPNSAKLYFEAYNGVDRTTAQTEFPPVVFSSDMESLQNTTEYTDNTEHFNVVYISYVYKNPVEGAYPEDLTASVEVHDPQLAFSSGGFDQKVKTITISQLPEGIDVGDPWDYLVQLANEELTRSRPTDIIDGEVNQNSIFLYERDYNLGDIIEIRTVNGGGAFMRVAEQIFKYDVNGKASYPSLVNKDSIVPGTWRSWKYDVDWKDMGSEEYWNNQ